MDLIIRNARFSNRQDLVDMAVSHGVIVEIGPALQLKADKEVDARGNLVTPPFIDPHLHLDAVLTAGIPRYNVSGSHPEGIQVWGEYKQACLQSNSLCEKNPFRRFSEGLVNIKEPIHEERHTVRAQRHISGSEQQGS